MKTKLLRKIRKDIKIQSPDSDGYWSYKMKIPYFGGWKLQGYFYHFGKMMEEIHGIISRRIQKIRTDD